MLFEERSSLIREGAPVSAVLDGSMGGRGSSPALSAHRQPAQEQRPAQPEPVEDLAAYMQDKDRSFYPSEIVSIFCRHLSASVEVTDQGIRAKRLRESWRELFTTASYMLLQQKRADLWEALRGLAEPLSKAEDPSSETSLHDKERAYTNAIGLCGELKRVKVSRDFFYESMLMDIRGLEVALAAAHRLVARELQRAELMHAMCESTCAGPIEAALRSASASKGSQEATVAAKIVRLFNELELARRREEMAAASGNKANAANEELLERIREMQAQIAVDGATILDLRNKLNELRRERGMALEKAGQVEGKVEQERRVLGTVKESLMSLEAENDALRGEVANLKDDIAAHQELHKEITRLESEIETALKRQRRAEEETEKYQLEASRERETRRRTDRQLLEIDGRVDSVKMERNILEERAKLAEEELANIKKDFEAEKTWRQEWNGVRNEVRDAVQRLYKADPPAVVDERSHQVMAMLQERIRSEQWLRSRVQELEDVVSREGAERMHYERRLAEQQTEMIELRIKAAKGGLGGYNDLDAEPYRAEAKAITREIRQIGPPSMIPKPQAKNQAAIRAGARITEI